MIVVVVPVRVSEYCDNYILRLPINYGTRLEICVLACLSLRLVVRFRVHLVCILNQIRKILDKEQLIFFCTARNGFLNPTPREIHYIVIKIHFAENGVADARSLQMLLVILLRLVAQVFDIVILAELLASNNYLPAIIGGFFRLGRLLLRMGCRFIARLIFFAYPMPCLVSTFRLMACRFLVECFDNTDCGILTFLCRAPLLRFRGRDGCTAFLPCEDRASKK